MPLGQSLVRLTQMTWGFLRGASGGRGMFSYVLQPGSHFNYAREVGDVWRNSVAYIGLAFLSRNLVKPELCVKDEIAKDESEEIDDHPMIALLARPNPFINYADLWKFTALQYSMGNAYWLKVRSLEGKVVQLYPIPSWMIEPWSTRTDCLIEFYRYMPGGQSYMLAPSEVVHFRNGLNPDNPMLGLSDLGYLMRELYTDNAINTMCAATAKNMGMVGLLVTPKDGEMIMKDDISEIRETMWSRTTGDQSGMPLVLQGAVNVERLGWSLEEMQLSQLRNAPGERILAALGLNAMALGLPSDSKTYSNYGESVRAAWHQGIIPIAEAFAECLYHQLLPDFGEVGTQRVCWEFDRVEGLQEDEAKKWERVGKAYQTYQVITRAEARRTLGFEADPEIDDVYFKDAVLEPTDMEAEQPQDEGPASSPDLEDEGPEGEDAIPDPDDKGEELARLKERKDRAKSIRLASEVRQSDPYFLARRQSGRRA